MLLSFGIAPLYFLSIVGYSTKADLMKGLSEQNEVSICPTAEVTEIPKGFTVQLSLSHCAELTPAARRGEGKLVVYSKPDKASDGTNIHGFKPLCT